MYRQQDANGGNDQQFHLSTNSSASFQNSPFSFSPFSASSLLAPSPQSGHGHQLSPFARQPSALHESPQRNLPPGSQSGDMGPPSTSGSPPLANASLARSSNGGPTSSARSLPSRNVTSDTITDAYVAFILACNPNFDADVDTSALRTNFQSPPKSDNKEFETFRLFELIEKFETKEIKTWGQLALDLGVDPPDTSKGQSTQKVQQYSVRLKRWMRAMHIDAFFEYLLGKQHVYFTKIPPVNDPYPVDGRDGVLAEDDLAIRALDPAFRPKRGRRRNSEIEQEEAEAESAKQPRLAEAAQSLAQLSSAAPISAHPMTAMSSTFHDPWTTASAVSAAVTSQTFAPWCNKPTDPQSAINTTAPSHLRWHLSGKNQDLSTPHPMSAHPSMAAHIDAAFDEPKSAVTPTGRKRRRLGTTVSSAWSSAAGSGTKPRGRPPASRVVQDGPFTTFPADPTQDKSGAMPTPITAAPSDDQPLVEPNLQSQAPIARSQSWNDGNGNGNGNGNGRPGRLSLQVPQHTGAPIRLATPPAPRVVVNGASNDSSRHTSPPRIIEAPPQPGSPRPSRKIHNVGEHRIIEREVPGFAFEVIKRVLASDLLRAELVGRKQRLSGEEAKRLADSILLRLNIPRADTEDSKDDIARLTAASWLGLGEQLRVPLGPATGRNKKLTVMRFRVDSDGYEEVMSSTEDDDEFDDDSSEVREVFDLSWNISMGGCNGAFDMKGLTLGAADSKPEDTHDFILRTWTDVVSKAGLSEDWSSRAVAKGSYSQFLGGRGGASKDSAPVSRSVAPEGDGVDWKAKYMELTFGVHVAKGEFMRIRDRLVERILDVLI